MTHIRRADQKDLSRIAEIYVFNNRLNFFPIFKDPSYSFGEMQVVSLIDTYFGKKEHLDKIWVYDDGVVKGFIKLDGTRVEKLFVEPSFQGQGVGDALLSYAVANFSADRLWALEKNTGAIRFYARHGFFPSGIKMLEEDTTEYLIELRREEKP